MDATTIDRVLVEHPLLHGLDVAGALRRAGAPPAEARFEADAYLFHEGEPADRCFLLGRGRVGLELSVPERGTVSIGSLGGGDVLGVSWLFPPYRWQFDACALEPVRAVVLDGVALREACAADPVLGYRLMLGFAEILERRLQATRLRLVELYGREHGR